MWVSCVVLCVVDVRGVTQLHDVVYIVCIGSSTILRFNATTHERLTDIHVKRLRDPSDIVACEQTSQLYVADYLECVWRVSADGADIMRWLTKSSTGKVSPTSLSVTSTRLLVSQNTNQLIQLDSSGVELRRVQLPDDMELPQHAIESPTTTFIVSHKSSMIQRHSDDVERTHQLDHWQISEVNVDGQVLRQFSGSRLSSLGQAPHMAIDSHGNVFVADINNHHILLLDAQLKLHRVIIDEHQLNYLCYREPTGQLLVGLRDSVLAFHVLRR